MVMTFNIYEEYNNKFFLYDVDMNIKVIPNFI